MAHARAGFGPSDWVALPLWARVRILVSFYAGWGYRKVPRVAFESRGVPDSLVALTASGTDCSTLTTSIVTGCRPDLPRSSDEYADLQGWDADRIDSPAEAVHRARAGVRVGSGGIAGVTAPGVYLFQGWKSTRPLQGHALIGRLHGDGLLELVEAQPGKGVHWRRSSLIELVERYPAELYAARLFDAGER